MTHRVSPILLLLILVVVNLTVSKRDEGHLRTALLTEDSREFADAVPFRGISGSKLDAVPFDATVVEQIGTQPMVVSSGSST